MPYKNISPNVCLGELESKEESRVGGIEICCSRRNNIVLGVNDYRVPHGYFMRTFISNSTSRRKPLLPARISSIIKLLKKKKKTFLENERRCT